ncbi:MAG: D-alanine--D-alanine ligase [bacterium]|nr:D-alanine--D-alanine ligase [bacterium]
MIVILAGGTSAEREVSLATAQSVAESLARQNTQFTQIDTRDEGWLERVKTLKPRAAIIALHGPYGEDGTVQKILEDNGIPYTGSAPKVSALVIDKIRTKEIVRKKFRVATAKDFTEECVVYPVVVKPNKQGSSYGVSIVKSNSELSPAIKLAKKYDEDGHFLIEEYVKGVELTCGVIDVFGKVTALPLVEIIPNGEFFDFQAKYDTESGCQEICPARIENNLTKEIQEKSVLLSKDFGIRQYCRIDWILRSGQIHFLEINTLPGMTPTSLINKELTAASINYDEFIKKLLETAH